MKTQRNTPTIHIMNTILQQKLRQKRLVTSGPEAVHFAVSVLLNAFALRKWELKMIASMRSYVAKVVLSIEQIFIAGARLIVQSNVPNMHRLMKKLVQEKDRCDLALRYVDRGIISIITAINS